MRRQHIARLTLSGRRFSGVFLACLLLACLNLTCNGEESPVTPGPPVYDAFRPTIESFGAKRDGTAVEGDIVYSGEDISLIVQATSHAFPQSCGLDEGEAVEGNLKYTFTSIAPDDVPSPGLISQSSPPSSTAVWRVPNLEGYDTGEGLLFTLQVVVLDECLDKTVTGKINLRAFANQGAPVVSKIAVQSEVGSASPVTEALDQNGFYEVEKSDKCRVTLTAESRTSEDICANRGVPTGDELVYIWSSSYTPINLSHDQDPSRATAADFDIPSAIGVGDTFDVECRIRDECTGTVSVATARFIVVGTPEITSLSGTADGINLTWDPYFDTYLVLRGDEVILTATGLVMDDVLCDTKGIHPDLEWSWTETTDSSPSISPEFNSLPIPNDTSVIDFVVPAASNGTDYSFRCTLTDRCNDLTDTETANFLVIVPPEAVITSVQRGTTLINPAQDSGRYEVGAGDTVTVRITASAASGTSFCEERGVSQSPPVEYYWVNPWEDLLTLNYDRLPSDEYSDLVFVVPDYVRPMDASLTCRVKDICNELTTEISVPFSVVED